MVSASSASVSYPAVTSLDLRCFHGVVFGYDRRGRRTIKAPNDAEVAKQIREGIEHRVQFVRLLPKSTADWPKGRCATCKDIFEPHRSGLCELCQCAHEKWLVATGLLEPRRVA